MTNVYDLSEQVKELWNEWEFRALILQSLFANLYRLLRKKTKARST